MADRELMLQYRLVDDLGQEWPQVFNTIEQVVGDLEYVQEHYSTRSWFLEDRVISHWGNRRPAKDVEKEMECP